MASGSHTIRLLAVLICSATCATTALGATSPTTACDRTTDLQSLEVPVSELSASVVGYITDEDEESLTVLPAQGDSTVPILNLAPRVAVILQDVFSAVAINAPPIDSPDTDSLITIDAPHQDDSPKSPVAGDAGQADSSRLSDTDSAIEEADAIPSVQRKIFRTDI